MDTKAIFVTLMIIFVIVITTMYGGTNAKAAVYATAIVIGVYIFGFILSWSGKN